MVIIPSPGHGWNSSSSSTYGSIQPQSSCFPISDTRRPGTAPQQSKPRKEGTRHKTGIRHHDHSLRRIALANQPARHNAIQPSLITTHPCENSCSQLRSICLLRASDRDTKQATPCATYMNPKLVHESQDRLKATIDTNRLRETQKIARLTITQSPSPARKGSVQWPITFNEKQRGTSVQTN